MTRNGPQGRSSSAAHLPCRQERIVTRIQPTINLQILNGAQETKPKSITTVGGRTLGDTAITSAPNEVHLHHLHYLHTALNLSRNQSSERVHYRKLSGPREQVNSAPTCIATIDEQHEVRCIWFTGTKQEKKRERNKEGKKEEEGRKKRKRKKRVAVIKPMSAIRTS